MKLPDFMCKVIGHKGYEVDHLTYKSLGGIFIICRRCGTGYGYGGWIYPNALKRLREIREV